MAADQARFEHFWDVIPVRLLHSTQLLIIEAIWRVGPPLSATQIKNIYVNGLNLSSYDYHCKRLVDLGLLEAAGRVSRRGALEHFYALKLD